MRYIFITMHKLFSVYWSLRLISLFKHNFALIYKIFVINILHIFRIEQILNVPILAILQLLFKFWIYKQALIFLFLLFFFSVVFIPAIRAVTHNMGTIIIFILTRMIKAHFMILSFKGRLNSISKFL